MPTVAVTLPHFQVTSWPYYDVLTNAGFQVDFPDLSRSIWDNDRLVEVLANADAVICGTEPYTPSVLNRIKARVLSRTGVGYDSVDVPAATERNIAVCRTPGAVHESVVEHAIGMIFAMYRDVVKRNEMVRSGKWERKFGPRITGKTLGIIGYGVIGKEIAAKAQLLGMTAIAYDPFAASGGPAGVELVPLEEIWRRSDVVSLHAPCTPETAQIINADSLAKMKDDALLINTARGGLINEADLASAMKAGKLRGAALDVLEQEPAGQDHPLFEVENIYFSPHMGGLDEESMLAMSNMAAQNIIDLHAGRWPAECIVNGNDLNGWKW
ncbi:phosphoglycerate dehydrogenase [Blastopirellula sp. JC732]|uniref:Phosphoglycerate dehydrogenase n=1 Tax=Blastopirellula sediminis TaxID=2894196 RepID=A0A9X1SFV2_9BACT|nr:phosphoglycerate dehydrogenase [Blastopirellula sediminis]MCC9609026.1 phosphoglycerate dehydrogenase [Blastopirellula sediminis]MCC9628197.1 phosphoglycerate dehydrogenase [Blastopirellula sediminis]